MRRPGYVGRVADTDSHAFLYTYCKSFFVNHVNMGAIDKINFVFMDSIEFCFKTAGKIGQKCSVHVTSGDVYSGHYCGYCESTKENPLTLRLGIDAKEAEKIGIPWMREIGVPYDVITHISFEG